MKYLSVNHQENIPENVVEQLNDLHVSDRGIEMGEDFPATESAQYAACHPDCRADAGAGLHHKDCRTESAQPETVECPRCSTETTERELTYSGCPACRESAQPEEER